MPGLIAAPGAVDQTFPNRPTNQRRVQPGQFTLVTLGEYLGIARHAQYTGELAKFVENPCAVG